jgi:MinD superfamily P-loop ATPase
MTSDHASGYGSVHVPYAVPTQDEAVPTVDSGVTPNQAEVPSSQQATQPANPPNATRQTHKLPSSVPEHGILGFIWIHLGRRLYSRFGWRWLATRTYQDRNKSALKKLETLGDVQRTIVHLNSKGGAGKSPLTIWKALAKAMVFKCYVVVMDLNVNAGHVAMLLGYERSDTIQLRAYLNTLERYVNHDAFIGDVKWEPETGVGFISCEPQSQPPLVRRSVEAGIRMAKRNAHTLYLDPTNGIDHPVNLAALQTADVVWFAGNMSTPASLDDITSTRQQYIDLGFEKKVTNGLIAIFGAKSRDRQLFADRYKVPIEQVFIIPVNRYMVNANVKKPARISKVPLKIEAILNEMLVAELLVELSDETLIEPIDDSTELGEPTTPTFFDTVETRGAVEARHGSPVTDDDTPLFDQEAVTGSWADWGTPTINDSLFRSTKTQPLPNYDTAPFSPISSGHPLSQPT